MKPTNFGTAIPLPLQGWSTGYQSIGSNTDSNPPLSALNFVQRITANTSNTLLNPIVNFAAGSGVSLAAASNTITISASGGGGGTISAGSNSTNVREISTAGASTTLWSPYDHAHAGISEITASSSNTLQRGTFNLRAGTGMALGLTDTDGDGELDTITLNNLVTASSGGGGGGITIQYPSLKPGTPTDDFAAASLAGGWTAHSNTGSFVTGNCLTQGAAWPGSTLEMQFSNQSGTIYQTHANTDLDFQVGGIQVQNYIHGGVSSLQLVYGIAALDSSGNGQCVMIFNDANCYFCPVVTYAQSGIIDTWTNFGMSQYADSEGHWWLRLKRVSTTWTAYASVSGRTWDKTFTTSTTAYTIAQLHFGMLRTGANYGRLSADYFQVDV